MWREPSDEEQVECTYVQYVGCVGNQKSWLLWRAQGPDKERCNFSPCELHSVTRIHLDHSEDDHSE